MRAYARSQVEVPTVGGKSVIIEVPSSSNPNKHYRMDITLGRCSCPAWTMNAKNGRKVCKHLKAYGFTDID
jgi:hypothetical protein